MTVGEILERENDRPAYVRFERRAVQDKKATLEAGHHVSRDEDYALVTPPYSKDCIEKKVETWFVQVEANVRNGRMPEKHLRLWKEAYDAWLKGQEAPLDGTSVKEWSTISPAQCKNLISAGCRTIEDLAQANDEALRRIGMGAMDLRNKAKAWLQAAKDHGPLVMQISKLQNENDQLKGSVESLQEQVKLLKMQLDSKDDRTVVTVENPVEKIAIADVLPNEPTPAEQYEAKYGEKPHHRMKESTILKKLQS